MDAHTFLQINGGLVFHCALQKRGVQALVQVPAATAEETEMHKGRGEAFYGDWQKMAKGTETAGRGVERIRCCATAI